MFLRERDEFNDGGLCPPSKIDLEMELTIFSFKNRFGESFAEDKPILQNSKIFFPKYHPPYIC